ncbi:uncharacterized protein LOC142324970 [Lycorma delicatula]|uniref:uncharacterized protein LOC142324970 n=1 Tax=Lycorma delicatula TaxID=130591 RepID=UPI003F50FB21
MYAWRWWWFLLILQLAKAEENPTHNHDTVKGSKYFPNIKESYQQKSRQRRNTEWYEDGIIRPEKDEDDEEEDIETEVRLATQIAKRNPFLSRWGRHRLSDLLHFKRKPAFSSWGGKRGPAFSSWGGKRSEKPEYYKQKNLISFNDSTTDLSVTNENNNLLNPTTNEFENDLENPVNSDKNKFLQNKYADQLTGIDYERLESLFDTDRENRKQGTTNSESNNIYSVSKSFLNNGINDSDLLSDILFASNPSTWDQSHFYDFKTDNNADDDLANENLDDIDNDNVNTDFISEKRGSSLFNGWSGKRMPAFNSWGGKRAPAFNSWGGKRAPAFNSWGGKRAPAFNSWGGKRAPAFNSWGGKRAPAFNSWGGKRAPAFNSWGGKRAPAFNSWGGKRAPAFNSWGGKRSPASAFNSREGKRLPAFHSWGGKRAPAFNSWGGKRVPAFNSWGGKRAPGFNSWGGKKNVYLDNEDEINGFEFKNQRVKRATAFNSWGGKRDYEYNALNGKRTPAFNSWGGKRAPAFNSWGGKRAPAFNSWGGKRDGEFVQWDEKRAPAFNSWGGKRAPAFNSWGGKRSDTFNNWEEKRAPAFNSWGGKRDTEFNFMDGKRTSAFNSWGGKRVPAFNSWGGKRAPAFNSWGGKRAPAFNSWGGKRSDNYNSIEDKRAAAFSSWGGKRAPAFNSWGGKRGEDQNLEGKRATAFNSWGGKRALAFNSWGGKRDNDDNLYEKRAAAFSSWGGKRAPAFNSWGGKRDKIYDSSDGKRATAFNSWGGKRLPAFHSWGGKRSEHLNNESQNNDEINFLELSLKETPSELNYFPGNYNEERILPISIPEFPFETLDFSTGDQTGDKLTKENDKDELLAPHAFKNKYFELDHNNNSDNQNKPQVKTNNQNIILSKRDGEGKRNPVFFSWGGKRSSTPQQLNFYEKDNIKKRDLGEELEHDDIDNTPDNEVNNLILEKRNTNRRNTETKYLPQYMKSGYDENHNSNFLSWEDTDAENYPNNEKMFNFRKKRNIGINKEESIPYESNSITDYYNDENNEIERNNDDSITEKIYPDIPSGTIMCCIKRVQYGDRNLFMQMLLRTKSFRDLSWPTIRPIRRGADFYPWGGKRSSL